MDPRITISFELRNFHILQSVIITSFVNVLLTKSGFQP